jgi:uncharacterized membrane protein
MFLIASMRSWWSNPRSIGTGLVFAVVAAGGVCYPFLIFFYGDRVRPAIFVAGGLVLTALQLSLLRSPVARLWRVPLMLSALVTIAIMLLDQSLAREAYPVVRSWGAAAIFAWSLVSPPSLIERFARLRYSDLPQEGVRYCRKVTVIWAVWLALNGAIAATLALRGELRLWVLWTGAISYVISGSLFLGEFAYRTLVLQRRVRS